MGLYIQPDPGLTAEEKRLAAVMDLDQRLPGGFQIGMPMHLARAIAMVEKLFTEHNLPLREELIGELTLWRSHAEQGLQFARQCELLMQNVIRLVDSANKRV